MLHRCGSIYFGFTGPRQQKSRDQDGPGIELAGRPDKLCASEAGAVHISPSPYAVLLGRTVKSRTCVRMLDICIPFSCDTKGRISAIN